MINVHFQRTCHTLTLQIKKNIHEKEVDNCKILKEAFDQSFQIALAR